MSFSTIFKHIFSTYIYYIFQPYKEVGNFTSNTHITSTTILPAMFHYISSVLELPFIHSSILPQSLSIFDEFENRKKHEEFFFFLLFAFCFWRQKVRHMYTSRLGVKLEMEAAGLHCSHSNARSELRVRATQSLTHWMGSGIKPASSWIQVTFISTEPQWELLRNFFFSFFQGLIHGTWRFPG